MRTRKLAGAGAALALSVTLVGGVPVEANDGDVIREGSCTGSTDWKLKASPENGRIEVEGEIDSNKRGQVWRWRMLHNGSLSARGKGVTKGPSGSFTARRLMMNMKGVDRIVFRARHNGEVCRGSVRF
jgi:hypothetical protein